MKPTLTHHAILPKHLSGFAQHVIIALSVLQSISSDVPHSRGVTVRYTIHLLCCATLVLLNGCERKPETVWPDKPGPKVLTSFAPVSSFAQNVVGNDGTVKTMLTSKGPHDHGDPTDEHLKLARTADVLLINGLGIDNELAIRLRKSAGNSALNPVAIGDRVPKDDRFEGACHHAHHEPGEVHDHGDDPHVWLSPKLAGLMVESIRDELKRADPAHAAGYDARTSAYLEKLKQLETDGINLLKDKKERRIITFHDSLRYFGDNFGIQIADFIQPEPGVDPSGSRMKKIIEFCKEKGIRVIAVEPQFSRNTAAGTILKELRDAGIDAEFVEIDTLETADPAELTPEFYELRMRKNLENLARVLR